MDGKIYIRCGTSAVTSHVYAVVYEPSSGTWQHADADMVSGWRGPAVVVDGTLYVLDQSSGTRLIMWQKETREWLPVGRLSTLRTRPPCQMVAIGTTIFVVGKGLSTVVIDVGNAGNMGGVMMSSTISKITSDDDVISCKCLAIWDSVVAVLKLTTVRLWMCYIITRLGAHLDAHQKWRCNTLSDWILDFRPYCIHTFVPCGHCSCCLNWCVILRKLLVNTFFVSPYLWNPSLSLSVVFLGFFFRFTISVEPQVLSICGVFLVSLGWVWWHCAARFWHEQSLAINMVRALGYKLAIGRWRVHVMCNWLQLSLLPNFIILILYKFASLRFKHCQETQDRQL